MEKEQAFRGRVQAYGFLLTVLVILIHSFNLEFLNAEELTGFSAFSYAFERFFSETLGQAAVPGFFLMSGYLFFRTEQKEGIGKAFFLRKWKARLVTLVLPYLLWNLLYMLVYAAFGRAELSPEMILKGIFSYYYNPVFWYMKQLILLSLVSPAVFVLTRGRLWPAALLCLFALAANYTVLPLHIVNEDALFYYSAGAAAAFHGRRCAEESGAALRLPAAAAVLLSVLLLSLNGKGGLYAVIAFRACAAAGMYLLLCAVYPGEPAPASFTKLSFYIYAVHYLVIRAARMAVLRLFGQGALPLFVLYLLLPALCTAAAAVSARFLRRFAPAVFRVLTGGRG